MNSKLEKLPTLESDADAERFVDEADLTGFDLSGMTPTPFRFERKDATMTMRIAPSLLKALKDQAASEGLKYQQLVTQVLEKHVLMDRVR